MRVKLEQQNNLKFVVSIKASTSDSTISKPQFRFLVKDPENPISFCFPMTRLENETDSTGIILSVTIPGNPEFFREGVDYLGEVEAIFGEFFFNPTSVRLQFQQKLQVKASPLVEENAVSIEELQKEIESQKSEVESEEEDEFAALIKQEPKPTKQKAAINEGALLDVLFAETWSKSPTPQPVSPPPKKAPQRQEKPSRKTADPSARIKNRLKLMISEVLGDFDK